MIRILCGLVVAIAGSTAQTAAGAVPQAGPLQLTLPPVCYAVVGVPMSIYYDNIVLTEKQEDFGFAVRCDVGTARPRRWTVTPTPRDVGNHRLAVTVRNPQGKVIERGKTVLHVGPADAGAGKAIRLLIVGDSLTNATVYPNEVARLLSSPGNPAWTMLGTRRPASATPGVAHEGYGGWTWQTFATRYMTEADGGKKSGSSPFVFAAEGKSPALDLKRYFEQSCGGQRPDFVTIMLGINDCFSANPEDPAAIDARISDVFARARPLIAAFRQAVPEAQIGICLTTPPNARESGFEANYHGRYHRWGWKRIQHRLVQRQLDQFGGRQRDKIYVVPTELNLDPVDGYPVNNGVHPNAAGYQQIGASIYAWLKSRLEPSR